MQTCQYIYQPDTGWNKHAGEATSPDILLAFGSGRDCTGDILVSWWQENFPDAQLIGCSSTGEILNTEVHTNSIIVTGIQLEKTSFELHSLDFDKDDDSFEMA